MSSLVNRTLVAVISRAHTSPKSPSGLDMDRGCSLQIGARKWTQTNCTIAGSLLNLVDFIVSYIIQHYLSLWIIIQFVGPIMRDLECEWNGIYWKIGNDCTSRSFSPYCLTLIWMSRTPQNLCFIIWTNFGRYRESQPR